MEKQTVTTHSSTTTATGNISVTTPLRRRPLSAYNLFFRQERHVIRAQLAAAQEQHQDDDSSDVLADYRHHYQAALNRGQGPAAADFQSMACTIAHRWKMLDDYNEDYDNCGGNDHDGTCDNNNDNDCDISNPKTHHYRRHGKAHYQALAKQEFQEYKKMKKLNMKAKLHNSKSIPMKNDNSKNKTRTTTTTATNSGGRNGDASNTSPHQSAGYKVPFIDPSSSSSSSASSLPPQMYSLRQFLLATSTSGSHGGDINNGDAVAAPNNSNHSSNRRLMTLLPDGHATSPEAAALQAAAGTGSSRTDFISDTGNGNSSTAIRALIAQEMKLLQQEQERHRAILQLSQHQQQQQQQQLQERIIQQAYITPDDRAPCQRMNRSNIHHKSSSLQQEATSLSSWPSTSLSRSPLKTKLACATSLSSLKDEHQQLPLFPPPAATTTNWEPAPLRLAEYLRQARAGQSPMLNAVILLFKFDICLR